MTTPMGLAIKRCQIFAFYCDEDGRIVSCPKRCGKTAVTVQTGAPDNHRFIIISTEDYNKGSDFVLGVPITSKLTPFKLKSGAEPIGPDDIENNRPGEITKGYVLPDKVCRLNVQTVESSGTSRFGEVKKQPYKKFMKRVFSFMGGYGEDSCPYCQKPLNLNGLD